jgi:hypothetical protein
VKARRVIWIVVAVAVAARVWGLGFGLPFSMARPDETALAGPAVQYLSGDLRPQFFQWPTMYSYLVSLAYLAYAVLGRPFTGFSSVAAFAESRRQSLRPFFFISRGLSAAFGAATVWGVFALGRRALDDTAGLVGALFLALAFLHVRDSHFGVTDVPMTALVVFAVLLILRWREHGGLGAAVAAGLVSGLAGLTKYNGLGTAAPFAVAWLLRVIDTRPRGADLRRLIGEGAAYTAAMAVGFFGASPYILIEWSRFRLQTGWVAETLASGHGTLVGRGWWYYPSVVLPAAIGWPIFLAGVAGMLGLLISRPRTSLVLFAYPIGYFAVAGRGYAVFARYILPVVPFLCLAAAWVLVSAVRRVTAGWSTPWRSALVAVSAAAFVAPTAVKTVQVDRLLATPDNRVVTARALLDIIPPGSSFLQTGGSYGDVPLGIEGRDLDVRLATFDDGAGAFRPADPDWVLVQRSPLNVYSHVSASLETVLAARYELVRRFPTQGTTPVPPDRIYDQQDAFFLPLTRLDGLLRPGPAFDLYARRAERPQ